MAKLWLALPTEVILVLLNHCAAVCTEKYGESRRPSAGFIEKEAYRWAEMGIDTLEEAVEFIQKQNHKNTRLSRLMDWLQIRGRKLTAAEEKYAQSWLDMGFEMEVIGMAYERTCLNTGHMAWPYMNKILLRWQEQGLLTAEAVKNGDKKAVPKGATGQMGQAELDAIQKLMQTE